MVTPYKQERLSLESSVEYDEDREIMFRAWDEEVPAVFDGMSEVYLVKRVLDDASAEDSPSTRHPILF